MVKGKLFMVVAMISLIVVGGFTGSSSSEAATAHRNAGNLITGGYADVPKDTDVASNKYSVIAKFVRGTSSLELRGATTRKSDKSVVYDANTGYAIKDSNGNDTGPRVDLIVDPNDNQKGRIKATYKNIGMFEGRSLDFEYTVTDWEKAGFNGGEYMRFYKTHIGFNQGGYSSVSLEGVFRYSDTGREATGVKGSYMTVLDFDAHQFMSFPPDMMNKIEQIYGYENTWVDQWRGDRVKNGRGYMTNIGARFHEAIDTDDVRGHMTILFDGHKLKYDWRKDWTKNSSTGRPYNMNRTLNWKAQQSAQYFAYSGEKPVRTEVLEPVKRILDSSGNEVTHTEANIGDTVKYIIHHTVPDEAPKFYYESYFFSDTLAPGLGSPKSLKVFDLSNKDVTHWFKRHMVPGQPSYYVQMSVRPHVLSNPDFYGNYYRFEIEADVISRHHGNGQLIENGTIIENIAHANVGYKGIVHRSNPTNKVTTKVNIPERPANIGMKELTIFTNTADKGLPAYASIDVDIPSNTTLPDNETVDLALYQVNGSERIKADSITLTGSQLLDKKDAIPFIIPSSMLEKNAKHDYEVVFENYNVNHISITSGKQKIVSEGYTSMEGIIEKDKVTVNGVEPISGKVHYGDIDGVSFIKYIGIVATVKGTSGSIRLYEEETQVRIPLFYNSTGFAETAQSKSGYGISVSGGTGYHIPTIPGKTTRVNNLVKGNPTTTGAIEAHNDLIEATLFDDDYGFYNKRTSGGVTKADVDLSNVLSTHAESSRTFKDTTYLLPKMVVDSATGGIYTQAQNDTHNLGGVGRDSVPGLTGGNIVDESIIYIPTWVDELGTHEVVFATDKGLGVHNMKVRIAGNVDINAFMFNHMDSPTPDLDELLLRPVSKDESDSLSR